jgi:hypothetical protein
MAAQHEAAPMQFFKAFPIAIIDEDFEGKNAAGRGMRDLAAAIEKEGFRVVGGIGYEDARRLVHIFNTESCWLISVDGAEKRRHALADSRGGSSGKARQERPPADLPVRGQHHRRDGPHKRVAPRQRLHAAV